jgi:hypothetical protein
MTRALYAIAVSALVLAGLASGSSVGETSTVTVSLKPGGVVPRPVGVLAGARGSFTGSFDKQADGSVKFEYRVSFARLTGPATGIHIHLGKPGTVGRVLISLCSGGRCSGRQGTFGHIRRALVESMRSGAYVDVHTAKNPRGEIRGQLTGVSAG